MRRGKSDVASWCRPCERELAREWARKNPDRHRENRRRYRNSVKNGMKVEKKRRLRHKYGLTDLEYNAMLDRQGNACAICTKPFNGSRTPDVDHDHNTEQVRALLCNPCNVGIDRLCDDPEIARRAYLFLTQWYGVTTPKGGLDIS
jgi:hypothetical protein